MIESKLGETFSPGPISGCLLDLHEKLLSHETIYRHIWADKMAGNDAIRRRVRLISLEVNVRRVVTISRTESVLTSVQR